MSKPALKCVNNAIFKQIDTLKLLLLLKWPILAVSASWENFLLKKFYIINYRKSFSEAVQQI